MTRYLTEPPPSLQHCLRTTSRIAFLFVGLVFLASEGALASPLVVYLNGAEAVTADVNAGARKDYETTASVYIDSLAAGGGRLPPSQFVFPVGDPKQGDRTLRWHYRYDCLWYTRRNTDHWVSYYRLPRQELLFLDVANPRGHDEFRKYRGGHLADADYGRLIQGQSLAPIDQAVHEAGYLPEDPKTHKLLAGIYFDVLPVDAISPLAFVLEKNRLRVWRSRGKYDIKNHVWRLEWDLPEAETIAVHFPPEPFHVFGTEQRYYVLTDSGQVYVSDNPIVGARTMDTARRPSSEPRQPITTFVVDPVANRHHAFALDPSGESVAYWELGKQLTPTASEEEWKARDAQTIGLPPERRGEWTSPDPVVRARAAVRYLIDEKKYIPKPSAKD